MAKDRVAELMAQLKCTREEALEIIECDKAIDRGERVYFDLDPEAEKQAKKYANTGTRQTNGQKTERKRKAKPRGGLNLTILCGILHYLL